MKPNRRHFARRSTEVGIHSPSGPAFRLIFYGKTAAELTNNPLPIHAALRARGLDPNDYVASPYDIHPTHRDSDKG